jgi:hypothetical protein
MRCCQYLMLVFFEAERSGAANPRETGLWLTCNVSRKKKITGDICHPTRVSLSSLWTKWETPD